MNVKQAQETETKHKAPPRPKHRMVAYPDYNRSLITQRHKNPVATGAERAVGTGITGAVLGALVARMMSNKAKHVGLGAAVGGAAGAVPGFVSGVREARSDNSRLLFLRRRMGINEPGELEALLQHPEVSSAMIVNQKAAAMAPAVKAEVLKRTLGALAGTALGAGWGYEVSPRVSGYDDVQPARQLSGFMGMATGGMVGALAAGNPSQTMSYIRSHPKEMLAIPGGLVTGELAPSAVAAMYRSSKATTDMAKATQSSSIPLALQRLMQSPVAKGVGVGTGLAGLASILTGLNRARTDEEIKENRGRTGMVARDFLKYLIPAAIGGGVAGSLAKRNRG